MEWPGPHPFLRPRIISGRGTRSLEVIEVSCIFLPFTHVSGNLRLEVFCEFLQSAACRWRFAPFTGPEEATAALRKIALKHGANASLQAGIQGC